MHLNAFSNLTEILRLVTLLVFLDEILLNSAIKEESTLEEKKFIVVVVAR